MNRKAVLGIVLLLACGGGADESETDAQPASEVAPQTSAENNAPASEPVALQLAECQHAPQAAIYNRPAKLWRAEQTGEDYLSLTVWELNAGGTEFSFARTHKANEYRIDTVTGSTKVGSGTVAMTPHGEGIVFEVNGKDQNGNDLRASVTCAKLVPLVVEGG